MGDLKKMLDPGTIAFISGGEEEDAAHRSILTNLLSSKGRTVFAVNPDREKVGDLESYPSVSNIDTAVDLAVIAVADDRILAVAGECGRKGVEGALILSGGGRTTTEERENLAKGLAEIKKDYGLRIVGPESGGLILPGNKLNATPLAIDPVPGNIAFISRSGSIGNAMLYWGVDNHIGFSMFVSMGSMADVDFADLIDYLQEDYYTRSIMIYLEHISDTRRFLGAARYFARSKPIVVLKPGRYPQTGDILNSHLGLKTGRDMVYDAAFRRVGVVRAKETEDFFDAAKVLVSRSLPRGSRLAVITNSGGVGIIACDTLTEQKGLLARLSEKTGEVTGPLATGSHGGDNPVDLSGNAGIDSYSEAIGACLKDPGVDSILVIYTPSSSCDPRDLAGRVVELAAKTGKPLVTVWMGGHYSREGMEVLKGANIPVYENPEDAVRAYMYMFNYHENIILLNETPEELPEHEMRLTNHLRAIIRNAVKEQKELLAGEEAAAFVKNYGIPVFRKPGGKDKPEGPEIPEDEWAVRSMRDADFGAVILFISMRGASRSRTGFAVGLPPLNRVLARHLMEEAEFYSADKTVQSRMEEFLVNFSNLVADFPEIAEIEIEALVMPDHEVYAQNTTIQVDSRYQRGGDPYPHLVIVPYPSRYIMPWKIRDGRDVLLRPIRAEDEPMMKEMMSALSEETLRVRFFGAMEIDHRMLVRFCNIDYDREITVAAELKEGDKRRIIGAGQIIVEADTGGGQFALLVSDDFQKQGLGEKLLDVAIGIAQDRGLREVYGIVLSENAKMLGLAKKMGFRPSRLPDGITRVALELN